MGFVGREAASPPPVKTAAKKTPAKIIQGKTAQQAYTEAAEGGLQIAAFAATAVGLHADAAAISMHAENVAPEIAKLAEGNAKVAAGLEWLTENGPYAALISACLPMLLQVAVNHGLVKAERFAGTGVVNPGVLEARFKLSMTEKASAMLKEQKALEEKLIIAQMELHSEMADAMQRNADSSQTETNSAEQDDSQQ